MQSSAEVHAQGPSLIRRDGHEHRSSCRVGSETEVVLRNDAEIGVVGAGPAGARAAELLAKQGTEVLLLDPRAPWEKPCGGGLTASVFRTVPDLIAAQSLARRIDHVRLEASAEVFVDVPLDDPLFVIPRIELSRWQLDRAVRAGATFEPAAVRRVERANSGWTLHLGGGGVRRVRRVIGADGAASTVRKAVAPDLRVELAPTRVLFAHGAGSTSGAIVMRFFRSVPGYAWNFPRPDHRSIGLGLQPGDWSRSQLDADLDSYWDTWGRCECVPAIRAGAVIGTAFHARRSSYPEIGGEDFALLGDAAGFADPATGEGIQNALRSGEMAAEAYAADGSFLAYPHIAFAALEPEFRIARRVRRGLYAWDLPVRLIEADRHAPIHALLAAIVHGGNEHDPRLSRNWWRELRRGRRHRSVASYPARAPAACGPDEATTDTPSSSATSGCTACGSDATLGMAKERRSRAVHALDPVPGSGRKQ